MRTLFLLVKGALQGVITVVAFAIFIVLEFYVVDITIDILTNKHGMDPSYGKYIWFFCYAVIAFEIGFFVLKFVVGNIKRFFSNLFG